METLMKRAVLILCGIALVATPGLWIYDAAAEWMWFHSHPAPGQLIDIGGYKLHLFCTGTGTPTVLLEAGVGDTSLVWNDIQRELGKSVRTCSYDRGGLGWSDASPLPRDHDNEAAELHRLLERASVPPPYILVGHSYGGDLVRVYAGHFPEQVAGLVLVEASNEDKWSRIPGMLQQWQGYRKDCRKDVWRARFALLRFKHDPLSPSYPDDVRSVAESLSYMRNAVIANCDEYASLIGSGPLQVGAVRSLGNVPLVVISAGKNIFKEDSAIPDRERAGAIWKQTQFEATSLSSRSRQVIASKSGHFVPHDQPALVIEQVLDTLQQLRQEPRNDRIGRLSSAMPF
jgi:pimeloyl-ACP methyl ester carboxylesterase